MYTREIVPGNQASLQYQALVRHHSRVNFVLYHTCTLVVNLNLYLLLSLSIIHRVLEWFRVTFVVLTGWYFFGGQ